MNSTDSLTFYRVKNCELAYSCMRVLVVLSGGVITDGFNWTAGVTVQQPQMLGAYRSLITQFKEQGELYLRTMQPIGFVVETDSLELDSASVSMM